MMQSSSQISLPRAGSVAPERSARRPVSVAAGAAAVGAGVASLAVLPGLLQSSAVVGACLLVIGVAEVAAGVAVVRNPTRRAAWTAAGLGLAVGLWWALTTTTGWSDYVSWSAQDTAIGFTDWVYASLQALTAALGLAAARQRPPRQRRRASTVATSTALLLPVALLTAATVGFATDGFSRLSQPPGRTLRANDPPLAAGSTTSLTYCSPGGNPLTMDVYEPPTPTHRPAPTAVYVHGGGFIFGNRHHTGLGGAQAGNAGALFDPLRRELTDRGMVVVSIDYRLAPLTRWPAQIQDAKCAIRFLRAHATQLGIDPAHIGVWGSSAGGTLAALLGTTGPAAGFDVGQYLDQPSTVQAVVDMFGAGDVEHVDSLGAFPRLTLQMTFGNSTTARHAASPITHVTSTAPPFLILYGTADSQVSHTQSTDLAQALTGTGVPTTLITVNGAGHELNNPTQTPTPTQLTELITTFLTQTLHAS